MKIEILKSFGPYAEGQIITTGDDDIYWHRRLRDAAIDGACKIYKPKRSPKPSRPAPESSEEELTHEG